MNRVDLNSDIGESFGIYRLGLDEEVIKYITSANIACGWHAGDPMVMERTVAISKKYGVAVGAHPGFMDMMGFGRRNISVSAEELKLYVKYQLGAMMGIAKSLGVRIEHLKPHGSMYNLASRDKDLARAIAEALYEIDGGIILVGLSGSELISEGRSVGLRVASEIFADREYNRDGRLVDRRVEGALIEDRDRVIERAIDMVKFGRVTSIDGIELELEVDTICVHGDNPSALEFVKQIRQSLVKSGVEVCKLSEIV